jgi:FkbM family methyltransferase
MLVAEVNPRTREKLTEELGKPGNEGWAEIVRIVDKGVWNEPRELELTRSDDAYHGFDRLNAEGIKKFPAHLVESASEITVQVDTLDNILDDLEVWEVDLFVLTVNGAEGPAVAGMPTSLSRSSNPRVVINTNLPEPAGKVSALLREQGLRVWVHAPRSTYWRDPDFRYAEVYACRP